MPRNWVHERLNSADAVVLVDGVDEVADSRRGEVRKWLRDLVGTFPDVRLVVTSRPHAVEEGWLEADGFAETDLQPMEIGSIEKFIDHWHDAVSREVNEDEAARLPDLASKLKATLRSNRAIRRLTTNPLLCGVICALHRDTNEQLPEDRLDLYERCCSMLLERRDLESGLALTCYPRLGYRQKRALLNDLAYWMIKNEWTEIAASSATERLGKKLENLKTDQRDGVPITRESVLHFFLERSGMLREPAEGKLDFAHRTFQEYMAAHAAVEEGDIGILSSHATNPRWREVIVLSAGLARPAERRALISSLLINGDKNQGDQYQLHLLAAACLDTAVDLDADVKSEVASRVRRLVPPKSMSAAISLAESAGEIAVPFLKYDRYLSARDAAACVRTLGLVASVEALQMLADYANDGRMTVLRELVRSSERFDVGEYVRIVASRMDARNLPNDAIGQALVRFGAQGLWNVDAVNDLSLFRTWAYDITELKRFPNLRVLNLRGLILQDFSPLRFLDGLQELILWDSNIRDISPLRGLTKLKYLDFAGTFINDLSPLSDMAQLESLDLRGAMHHSIPSMPKLPSLRTLYVTALDLTGLEGICQLTRLTLSGHQIRDLTPIEGFTDLEFLDIFASKVTDLAPLRRLTRLQHLDLLTDATDIEPLRGLTTLSFLALRAMAVSDLSPLWGLNNLQVLWLGRGVSDEQISAFRSAHPAVRIEFS
jgi:Leucine-rich repeat (LRR) protein